MDKKPKSNLKKSKSATSVGSKKSTATKISRESARSAATKKQKSSLKQTKKGSKSAKSRREAREASKSKRKSTTNTFADDDLLLADENALDPAVLSPVLFEKTKEGSDSIKEEKKKEKKKKGSDSSVEKKKKEKKKKGSDSSKEEGSEGSDSSKEEKKKEKKKKKDKKGKSERKSSVENNKQPERLKKVNTHNGQHSMHNNHQNFNQYNQFPHMNRRQGNFAHPSQNSPHNLPFPYQNGFNPMTNQQGGFNMMQGFGGNQLSLHQISLTPSFPNQTPFAFTDGQRLYPAVNPYMQFPSAPPMQRRSYHNVLTDRRKYAVDEDVLRLLVEIAGKNMQQN